MDERRPDPNKERNDPMVPEYWQMGEDLQDAIRRTGFEAEAVEGIAVDVHDLLQAAEKIRTMLGPRMLVTNEEERDNLRQVLRELAFEFDHIRWHCDAAVDYLDTAARKLEQPIA
ncbi:MAG TPA: hypothetical protein VGE01_10025 [Fimbriimonas sp.]